VIDMTRAQVTVLAAGLVGALLVLLGIVYFAVPAHSLPALVPGHVSAGDTEAAHHHVKHGVAALAVGLAVLAYAWMNSGPAAKARRAPLGFDR
jgi:hypothetical protein